MTKLKKIIEYIPIPADFGQKQERRVSFRRSMERFWRKHDKMCEEDRLMQSGSAQGKMLEKMKEFKARPRRA